MLLFIWSAMQLAEYEKGLIVAACWRLAKNNDVNELVAIGCCLRNWVIPRFGVERLPLNGKVYFDSYSEAVQQFFDLYPTRSFPSYNEPALVDQSEGLLLKVDSIYDCSLPDVTSSRSYPGGARYFMRSAHGNTMLETVISQRPLIGNFGSQSFYA